MKHLESMTVRAHTFTLISETRLHTSQGETHLCVVGQKHPLAIVRHAPAGQIQLLAIDEERIARSEVLDLVRALAYR